MSRKCPSRSFPQALVLLCLAGRDPRDCGTGKDVLGQHLPLPGISLSSFSVRGIKLAAGIHQALSPFSLSRVLFLKAAQLLHSHCQASPTVLFSSHLLSSRLLFVSREVPCNPLSSRQSEGMCLPPSEAFQKLPVKQYALINMA